MLFSTPTLSSDIADLAPVDDPAGSDALSFHQDEWCQVEFLPASKLAEAQRNILQLKTFEEAHRTPNGWREVHVRFIERKPVVSGPDPVARLERMLGTKTAAAPLLFTSDGKAGRVRNGFSVPLQGGLTLYGVRTAKDIRVLGVDLGATPDSSALMTVFRTLNRTEGVILVDWRAQMVLVSVRGPDQIEVWRP